MTKTKKPPRNPRSYTPIEAEKVRPAFDEKRSKTKPLEQVLAEQELRRRK